MPELALMYVEARSRFVRRIGEVSGQLDACTSKHAKESPTLVDVARFEGMRATRARLLAEFTQFEDKFVLDLLQDYSGQIEQPPDP
jgi:hypothetical protein